MDVLPHLGEEILVHRCDIVRGVQWFHDELHRADHLSLKLDYPYRLLDIFHGGKIIFVQDLLHKGKDITNNS